MKTLSIIIATAAGICLLNSCSGDHASQSGKDTVINTYKTPKDTSKMDTTKGVDDDMSGTGGTKNPKDTTKKN